MTWPAPQPGLVIKYSYLWHHEALAGQEEGINDRPCAVVVAFKTERGQMRVYALPITHSAPPVVELAIEIPALVKARLGLDGERSWIMLDEVNAFVWPGPDLRFLPGRGPESSVYGFMPPGLFRLVRDRFTAFYRANKVSIVARTE